MSANLKLHNVLFENKLTGPNFIEWIQALKIVLRLENIAYVLDNPIPDAPSDEADQAVKDAFWKHFDDSENACCLMLGSMSIELQKQYEDTTAYGMLMHLRSLYLKKARNERYDLSQELFRSKMAEGSAVSSHVLKMISLIESLEQLGFVLPHQLNVDLILQSLPNSFSNFVVNFNMNDVDVATLPQLLNILILAEESIKHDKGNVLLVEPLSNKKSKLKKAMDRKAKGTCFHCGQDGHWKSNCKEYLDTMEKKKLREVSTSGICGLNEPLYF